MAEQLNPAARVNRVVPGSAQATIARLGAGTFGPGAQVLADYLYDTVTLATGVQQLDFFSVPQGGAKHIADLEAKVKALADKNAEAEAKREAERAREGGHTRWVKSNTLTQHTGMSQASSADRIAIKSYDRRVARKANGQLGPTESAHFDNGEMALAAGAFVRKAIMGNREYAERTRDNEILTHYKVQVEYSGTAGGYTVPAEFLPVWIDLKEQYGGATSVLRQYDMANYTLQIPRILSGQTVYTPGEGGAITASDISLDLVTITAKKRAAATKITNELLNDSTANFADEVVKRGVYELEKDLEFAVVAGDGTSTYWSQLGYEYAFRKVITDAGGTFPTNAANQAGIVVGSGNSWTALDDVDFGKASGRLPQYAAMERPVWLCSRAFHEEVIVREQRAAGGASYESTAQGATPTYKGFPVVISQAMPRVSAADQFSCYLGAFSLGGGVGRVRGSQTVASSTDVDFLNDQIVYRFTHRAGVCIHDVGNYSATATSREPGPIVAVITST